MADNSVDAICTDPPYGLSFMGKKWDYDVPGVDVWSECLRVLKPGGHLLAFAGTRTQHRMAVRIEDAGFEIRDMIAWVYGSGFPKSMDVSKQLDKMAGAEREVIGPGTRHNSKRCAVMHSDTERLAGGVPDITAPATEAARQWQGWGTALKPALEPITVARKPLIGTVAANVLAHGTGAINVDGCRIATDDDLAARSRRADAPNAFNHSERRAPIDQPLGRWPANLILSDDPEVLAGFPLSNGSGPARTLKRGQRDGEGWGMADEPGALRDAGTGSAARFFYQVQQDENVCGAKTDTIQECNQENASAAASNSIQLKRLDDSVQSLVAIAASHAGNQLSALISRFMSDTASELKRKGATSTPTILSIAQKFWHELLLTSTQVTKESRVNDAALSAQTFTTMIIQSLLSIAGCADVAILDTIVTSLELGAKGCSEPPSRFMYCAKASRADRNEGLTSSDKPAVATQATMREREDADWASRNGNHHPTVKPTDLMAYLCRLVTPPGGVVLDPFMGSGSTGKAAMREGFRFIGCEMSPEYLAIAQARIQHEVDKIEAASVPAPQLDMFA